MSVTSSSRSLDDLHPLVKALAELAIEEIKSFGINPLIVETYRSQERQYYLYCKGRSLAQATKGKVPLTKAIKYIAQLTKEKYKGGQVTWTLNSQHIQKRAIDVIPQRRINGKMTAIWNARDTETRKIIATMSKYGFEAGANWTTNADSPHFQVKLDLAGTFKRGHSTYYVTLAIQKALNKARSKGLNFGAKLKEDGIWGGKTDLAVIEFRKFMKYKTHPASLGKAAIKDLLRFL